MTPARPGTFYTIAPDRPFLDDLAAGIMARGADPEALAAITVLLPTRRACRALGEAFLRVTNGLPTVLPRLLPLGDDDGDEIGLLGEGFADDALGGEGALAIPPAIDPVRRLLLLAKLVRERPPRMGDDQAVRLAAELARLIDQAATERRPLTDLATLVPDDFARHWGITLEFLRILTEHWPKILQDEGALDPAERRNRLLDARAAMWRADPPRHPVIAAGTTGSVPATANLLGVIATLPDGAVVLPGFDRALGPEALALLGPTHPQFGMATLLANLGIGAGAVRDWPHGADDPAASESRAALRMRLQFVAAAIDPPDAPGRILPADGAAVAFARVKRVDCAGPAEEAQAIALMLREALETPGRTAALITPDRALARRVAAELGRFAIAIDDSAGVPLSHTPPGAFLRLTARLAAEQWAPIPLLAALKHPLAAGGEPAARFRAGVRALERLALRGPRPGPGAAGLRAVLAALDDADGRNNRARALGVIDRIDAALAPFETLLTDGRAPLPAIVRAHIAATEALAATEHDPGAVRLWAGDAGEMAAGALAAIEDGAKGLGDIAGHAYPGVLDALLGGASVRPRFGRHPRLHIWGLLEARMQRADRVVLGGLNERTWPPEAQPSPWMSRPMMQQFGLAQPERRIGLAAHDFVQAMGAAEVFITRAVRAEGSSTVAARWLRRLDTQLKRIGAEGALGDDRRWLDWAAALDRPPADAEPASLAPPEPCPPVALRPRRLSVTRIETLIRDPYAVYARHILRLRPLDPIDADPGADKRGTAIHEALEQFIRAWPGELPGDAFDKLIAIGRDVFARHVAQPAVRALWWPRFERAARWFIDSFERPRRAEGTRPLMVEAEGLLTFDAPGGPFTLSAKADRIDRTPDGIAVIDYKTGATPSKKEVESGLAPQLTLEAAMVEAGAFAGVPKTPVAALAYVQLSGLRDPGKSVEITSDVAAHVRRAEGALKNLIALYDDAATPYRSRLRVKSERRAGDYDHLARVREWSSGDSEDET